jgi:hypothetical protein
LEHEWGMTLFYTLFEPTTRTFLVGNSVIFKYIKASHSYR